jgi:hypothetical protein
VLFFVSGRYLGEKKDMRYTLGIIGLALLAAACVRDPLFPGTPRSSHEPGSGRQADTTDAPPPGGHVYLTAVRFPDGYAWDLDTCAVDGEVWIDLYRDGERVRSLPAGASVHPDMHRYTDGHLYADWSTDTETVVARDGAELFRFVGRESLRGFLVREDGVHTLGQDRDGSGFTYRVDGRILYRSETGVVLGGPDTPGATGGALSVYGEDLYYACCLPSERGKEYHVMRNAERYQSFPVSDGTLAVLVNDGKVARVRSKPRSLVLEVDGKETRLALGGGEYCLWSRLVAWEGDIVALVCAQSAGKKRYYLQTAGGKTFSPMAGETVSDVLSDGKRMGWTVTDGRGDLLRVRWSDGGVTEGTGGFLVSGRCALLRDGHLFLALTGRDGAPNRLQEDGVHTDIPFNGYFTSVTVE